MGLDNALLRKILAGFAGEFRKKTTHRIAGRLSDKIRRTPATSRVPRTGGRQLKGSVPPKHGAPVLRFANKPIGGSSHFQARKRRPVKPATISGWRDALNAWLLPNLGDKLLADVSNKAVRELVEKMSAAGLSAKTIVNYVQVVKLVVASRLTEEGDQVYPRRGITILFSYRSFAKTSSTGQP